MAKQLKITLKKGLVGSTQVQKDNVHSLGLHKIHQTVVREDTPVYRGMANKVRHLVTVEEID
ncbi:50S ribosomal protein L30 [Alloscardovia theropitheci]|uniref:Large ribosomal subunit protein uL30 n=1 Tax=Alloscardovia theropitheci TaxID=2496842 RepID=A0A4R0QWL3_9BIFI|nr:50S ribosomal protein L30 [Alloscardovia theropitheci]TCD53671.1 50S ribosomal protein L30 [Alloscardovia theropitheci]